MALARYTFSPSAPKAGFPAVRDEAYVRLDGWRTGARMRGRLARRVVAVAGAVLAGIGGFPGEDGVLTNEDVVRLTAAGASRGMITEMIRSSSEADFDVGVEAVVRLLEAGVDPAVVEAMVTLARRDEPKARPAAERVPPAVSTTRGTVFRDPLAGGGNGPEMVVIPAGRFSMGCSPMKQALGFFVAGRDGKCRGDEQPERRVTIQKAFALSVYEVTFDDFDLFRPREVPDEGWGRGRRPVINVSWDDAQRYVEWLSVQTGATYRLPTEAEWEYAARAGSRTRYWWGEEIGTDFANCVGCGSAWERQTAPVGSFAANAFGLHDVHGNVREHVEDCFVVNQIRRRGCPRTKSELGYRGAPRDGSAWFVPRTCEAAVKASAGCKEAPEALYPCCAARVTRGGSWRDGERWIHLTARSAGDRSKEVGIRVARTL